MLLPLRHLEIGSQMGRGEAPVGAKLALTASLVSFERICTTTDSALHAARPMTGSRPFFLDIHRAL
jgi:hypothetical protein